MKHIVLLMLLIFSTSVAAQAYRWVDANGVTHYSDSPPPEPEQALSLETREYRAAQRRQHAEDTTPELELEPPAAAPSIEADTNAKASVEVTALDCTLAVGNITAQLSEHIQQQRSRVEAGQLSRADYEASRDQALETQRTVSEDHCQYANGATLAFYRCMSADQADLNRCRQQHSPLL